MFYVCALCTVRISCNLKEEVQLPEVFFFNIVNRVSREFRLEKRKIKVLGVFEGIVLGLVWLDFF